MKKVVEFYKAELSRIDRGVKDTIGWGHRISQTARFDAILRHCSLENASLLDLGCGDGDLPLYLREQGIALKRYAGVDVMKEFIAKAKERYAPGKFRSGTIFGYGNRKVDWVVSVGAFNDKWYDTRQECDTEVRKTIRKMFELCREGIAFDMFSTTSLNPTPNMYRVEPSVMLAFCKVLTERVILDWSYAPQVYTMVLYKKQSEWRKMWNRKRWK